MYSVIIKGRTLEELKEAVSDIHTELHSGFVSENRAVTITKDLTAVHEDKELDVHVEPMTPVKAFNEAVESVNPLAEALIRPAIKAAETVLNDLGTDSEGIPWDSRIHSGNQEKVKDGTWRKRRGVDDETFYRIKNEIKTNKPTNVAAPVVEAAPVVTAPVVAAPVVTAPVVAAPPLPQVLASGHTFETFKANFPMILGNLITDKKITQEYVNQLKTHFQLEQIWNANDIQLNQIFDMFAKHNLVQKVG